MNNDVAVQPEKFPAMLNAYKAEIARALPKHLDGERMARIALTCFRQTPALGKCDPKSVFAAVIMASQLGLEPGIGGQAYLIPYGRECQFVPGWQGLTDLVSRAGRASVWTGAVFEGDEFDYALGDSPYVTHRPAGDEDESRLTHVYAIGRIENAKWPVIEVWPIDKVIRHRDRYNKVGGRHYSFKHLEMYGRKIALLQVIKYMPKSVELQTAVALEHAAEKGTQRIEAKDAIEGTWAPLPEEESTAAAPAFEMPRERQADAAPAVAVADMPNGIHGLSDSMERLLLEAARGAGITRDQLLERYPAIGPLNYNEIRAELKTMVAGE